MRMRTAADLGNLVRERRHHLQLSQQDAADRAGVSRPWLASVEAGHQRAELGKVLSLLDELGLTLDLAPAQRADDDLDLDTLLDRHRSHHRSQRR